MREEWRTIEAAGGACDTFIVRPEGDGPWPAVVMYPDAGGHRPAFETMGRRLAANGYYTVLPNVFYREFPAQDLPVLTPERVAHIVGDHGLTRTMVADDAEGVLEFLARQEDVSPGKVGFTGYCLGGSCALMVAARYPDRVGAALSFHGARMHYDKPDSFHLFAERVRCPIFIGVAETDPHQVPGEIARLESLLAQTTVPYRVEVFPRTGHGFSVLDSKCYQRDAYERARAREIEFFGDTLGV